jgi:hypothetical protein
MGGRMGRSEFLADRGLQIVKKYCVVYWDEKTDGIQSYSVQKKGRWSAVDSVILLDIPLWIASYH